MARRKSGHDDAQAAWHEACRLHAHLSRGGCLTAISSTFAGRPGEQIYGDVMLNYSRFYGTAVEYRYGQTVAAEVARKFEERRVFFAHIIQNSDRASPGAAQANNLAPRPAKLTLQGQGLLWWLVKILLKESFQYIHFLHFQKIPEQAGAFGHS